MKIWLDLSESLKNLREKFLKFIVIKQLSSVISPTQKFIKLNIFICQLRSVDI